MSDTSISDLSHYVSDCTVLSAACQIICIHKQHTNHMEDDIKRILQDKQFHLQLKSEQKEMIQNVLERRFNGSVTHWLRKEHVLRSPPSHFGQGKIIYANHLP